MISKITILWIYNRLDSISTFGHEEYRMKTSLANAFYSRGTLKERIREREQDMIDRHPPRRNAGSVMSYTGW